MNVGIDHPQDTITFTKVQLGGATLYFSYSTCIAVAIGGKLYVCENVWSVTTGKHLNYIEPNHKYRLSFDEFQKLLSSITITVTKDEEA